MSSKPHKLVGSLEAFDEFVKKAEDAGIVSEDYDFLAMLRGVVLGDQITYWIPDYLIHNHEQIGQRLQALQALPRVTQPKPLDTINYV